MRATPNQVERIRLLSDRKLYQDAISFIEEHGTVETAQVNSLLNYASNFDELTTFAEHQSERQWSGAREHYRSFYRELVGYLQGLRRQVREAYGFVPEGLVAREEREQTAFFAGLLAREFIQHLAAENLWKEAGV